MGEGEEIVERVGCQVGGRAFNVPMQRHENMVVSRHVARMKRFRARTDRWGCGRKEPTKKTSVNLRVGGVMTHPHNPNQWDGDRVTSPPYPLNSAGTDRS